MAFIIRNARDIAVKIGKKTLVYVIKIGFRRDEEVYKEAVKRLAQLKR